MKNLLFLTVLFCLSSAPAVACIAPRVLNLKSVLWADVVFIGRMSGVERIQNPVPRNSDYHLRYEFKIDEILAGKLQLPPVVLFELYAYREPEKLENNGNYVVALEQADNRPREQHQENDSVPRAFGPGSLRVLQANCDRQRPFIFQSESEAGRAVRQIFDGEGAPEIKAEVLARFLGLDGRGNHF